jgi:hypothetical protein
MARQTARIWNAPNAHPVAKRAIIAEMFQNSISLDIFWKILHDIGRSWSKRGQR